MANGHGGARPGAGRKPGLPNKLTAQRTKKIEQSGLTPLEFMLRMLRNPKSSKEDKMWAAERAAPYVHARLAAVAHSGPDNGPMITRIERVIISPREIIEAKINQIKKRMDQERAVIEDKSDAEPETLRVGAGTRSEEEREPEIVEHIEGPRKHYGGW